MNELQLAVLILLPATILIVDRYFNNLYLETKAKAEYRTAIFIRGKFYYLIPDEEYLELMDCKRSQDKLSSHFLAAEEATEKREARK
jgi:hypothetical protein